MKKLWLFLASILGIIVLCALVMVYCYFNVDHGDKLNGKKDVIIMIDGGDNGRYTEAGRLYQEKYGKKVMISPANPKLKDGTILDNVKAVIDAGVNEKDIIKETKSTSTYTNATETLKLMKENNLKSAIVVTSDYHATRTKFIYNRVNKNYGYDITVLGIKDKDGKKWSETSNGKHQAFRESFVTPAYWLGLYKVFDL